MIRKRPGWSSPRSEADGPAARGRVEVDPRSDVLAEVVGHRGVEGAEGEAFPGRDLAIKDTCGGYRAAG